MSPGGIVTGQHMKEMRSNPRKRGMQHRRREQLSNTRDDTQSLDVRQLVAPPSSPSQVLATSILATTIMPLTTTVLYSTTTLPIASQGQTPITALLNNQEANPAVSTSPTSGSYISEQKPMLQTSTIVIIIVAAVGITLALFFIGLYYWRKKSRKREDFVDKTMLGRPPLVSAPLGSNWGTYSWDATKTFAPQAKYKEVDTPEKTYIRPGTSSPNRAVPTRAPYAPPNVQVASSPVSFYIPQAPATPIQLPRTVYTPPQADPADLASYRRETRPSSLSQDSTLVPPPPKPSRFSRYSQMFRTSKQPHIPDLPPPMPVADVDRYSTISDAESVARYRTVDSWVGQQAGHYEERRIQERIHYQLDEALGELHRAASTKDDKRMTKMKTIPLKDSSSVFVDGLEDDEVGDHVTELSMLPDVARSKSVKRTKSTKNRSRKTNDSDLTIFKAHPGTKVDIPASARIPSAILDNQFGANGYAYGRR